MKHSPLTMKDFIERIRIFESQATSKLNEANPLKNAKGQFSGPEDAVVYSFTNAALKSGAVKDKSKIKRGKYNKSTGKTTSLYGANTSHTKSCGRKRMDGTNKSPTHSCSKYPEEYQEQIETQEQEGALDTALIASKDNATAISTSSDRHYKPKSSKSLKSSRNGIRVTISRKPVVETLVQKQGTKSKQQVILSDLVDGILELIESTNDDELIAHIFQELDRIPNRKMSADELKSICSKSGYVSPDRYLDFINKSALASNGKLNEPQQTK